VKINGLKIQQAIREATKDRDLADSRFAGSLKAFPDEKKPHPLKLSDEFEAAERRIAALQTAQARYNISVMVEADGRSMTLQEAVKLLGGAQRLEEKWREAAKEEADRYGGDTRDKDAVVRTRQVDHEKCVELARMHSRRVNGIRYAIGKGNATELDLDIDL
jgi:hypothetical protein